MATLYVDLYLSFIFFRVCHFTDEVHLKEFGFCCYTRQCRPHRAQGSPALFPSKYLTVASRLCKNDMIKRAEIAVLFELYIGSVYFELFDKTLTYN